MRKLAGMGLIISVLLFPTLYLIRDNGENGVIVDVHGRRQNAINTIEKVGENSSKTVILVTGIVVVVLCIGVLLFWRKEEKPKYKIMGL